ncbi:helix-turn-helix transcriptional regulator [Enterococcus sp. BWM-S5]|uniref:Helix-turn-helix transcriptional regulator n=1 Tax=Enterococcus larvae TaxID=2794352 RepID=A0ABS4CGW2_9ENTE|nr:helix-turn-helix transcriptional regulator [Enterococcus larvae]MBP1045458.1 helix-turn-helix transcriptional regulator [Enterococcus larvae]
MNISETLLFFRRKLKLTQKEMWPGHDTSAYSRIENGKQDIKISDLSSILDQLSISPEEFFLYSSIDEEQKRFRNLFQYCANHLNNQTKKNELCRYFSKLETNSQKNLKELSNYIAIKVFFSQYWEDIKPIKKNELDDIFSYLNDKSYYIQYDYTLMSNTIFLMSDKQAEKLVSKAIPIKDEENRNTTTKQFAYNLITNLITTELYKLNYEKANNYLILAKRQNEGNQDYKYRMNVEYLSNLHLYLTKGNYQYIRKVYDYIHFLNDLGETQRSKLIEKEVELLTLTSREKDNSPINTLSLD